MVNPKVLKKKRFVNKSVANRVFANKRFINKEFTNRGFTLVEMIVVISIFAILLGILIPSLNSLIDYRAERAAKSIKTGFERLRTEAESQLVAEMKLEKKSDGYYISYCIYKGKKSGMVWTEEQKIAPAKTKIEYKLDDLYQKGEINGRSYQEIKEGEPHALLFAIDRNKGGFRALQEEQVTTDEVESFLEHNEDLTYHDLKSNNVEAVCYYIRVSGRVKKSIITLHQKTGKITMSSTTI
ncbi:MAG: type II secretion system protein [Eubacterium sp.]|nr:type II secretion system protein [Eubacterium sp.]